MQPVKDLTTSHRLRQRQAKATFFKYFCIAVTASAVLILGILLYQIISDGYRWVDWQFMTSYPSRFPEKAGILSAFVGTL